MACNTVVPEQRKVDDMSLKELSQLYYIDKMIERDERRLEELRSNITSLSQNLSGMPKNPSIGDPVGDKVGEMVDLAAKIEKDKCHFHEEKARLEKYLRNIKNSTIQVNTLVATYHKIQRLTGTFVKDGETGLRLFSELELKRLMGFPEDFIVPVSRTQMYRQFGNSVAVPMIKAVADAMKSRLISAEMEIEKKKNPIAL